MQMVKRIIGGFFLTLILLWLLAPKQEIYYLLEKELKRQDIIISNETFKDRWYGLEINNADIYLKGINIAKIESIKLNIFFLYNTLSAKSILTDKGVHNIAPKSINSLNATYSIIQPLDITLAAMGSFGVAEGSIKLTENLVKIRLKNIKNISALRKFLKKDEEGFYYETTY